MIAVSVQETTADDVAAWAETYDLRYPIGFDATSAVFHAYDGFGLPTHVFIDRDGVIRHLQYGPLDLEQVAAIVEPLLATEPAERSPGTVRARRRGRRGQRPRQPRSSPRSGSGRAPR